MSKTNLYFLDAGKKLTKDISRIDKSYKDALKIAQKTLRIGEIDVVIRPEPYYTIPELGIGGSTSYYGYIIYISLDPDKKFTSEDLLATFLHEFHHAARFQKTNHKLTLGEEIVREGLACRMVAL